MSTTYTTVGNSVLQWQNEIDKCVTGDTVVSGTPSTPATWTLNSDNTNGIVITKSINLDFTGVTITMAGSGQNTNFIKLTNEAAGQSGKTYGARVTGGTFVITYTSENNAAAIVGFGSFSNARLRIDNNTFSGVNQPTFIWLYTTLAIIDHNTFSADGAAEMIHVMAYGSGDGTGWSIDVTPGSSDAVYVEDNTFSRITQSGGYTGCAALQSYYGARTVFRYNTCNFVHVDQHGTTGAVGARWWEIYENTFWIPLSGSPNQANFIKLRDGSGVCFNNKKTGGSNGGAGSLECDQDGGEAYPAPYQVGRGKSSGPPQWGTNEVLDPAYFWNNTLDNNGVSVLPASSASSNVVLNRDFFNATKSAYTAYTYPFPLTSGGSLSLKRLSSHIKLKGYSV